MQKLISTLFAVLFAVFAPVIVTGCGGGGGGTSTPVEDGTFTVNAGDEFKLLGGDGSEHTLKLLGNSSASSVPGFVTVVRVDLGNQKIDVPLSDTGKGRLVVEGVVYDFIFNAGKSQLKVNKTNNPEATAQLEVGDGRLFAVGRNGQFTMFFIRGENAFTFAGPGNGSTSSTFDPSTNEGTFTVNGSLEWKFAWLAVSQTIEIFNPYVEVSAGWTPELKLKVVDQNGLPVEGAALSFYDTSLTDTISEGVVYLDTFLSTDSNGELFLTDALLAKLLVNTRDNSSYLGNGVHSPNNDSKYELTIAATLPAGVVGAAQVNLSREKPVYNLPITVQEVSLDALGTLREFEDNVAKLEPIDLVELGSAETKLQTFMLLGTSDDNVAFQPLDSSAFNTPWDFDSQGNRSALLEVGGVSYKVEPNIADVVGFFGAKITKLAPNEVTSWEPSVVVTVSDSAGVPVPGVSVTVLKLSFVDTASGAETWDFFGEVSTGSQGGVALLSGFWTGFSEADGCTYLGNGQHSGGADCTYRVLLDFFDPSGAFKTTQQEILLTKDNPSPLAVDVVVEAQ